MRGARVVSAPWYLVLPGAVLLCALAGCPRINTDVADVGAEPDVGAPTCVGPALRCDGEAVLRCNGGAYEPTGEVCDPVAGESCQGGVCVRACDAAAASRSYVGCDSRRMRS